MKFINIFLLTVVLLGYLEGYDVAGEALRVEKVNIRLGHQITIKGEKLKIKFDSVLGDSRCPEGVECVWEGNGSILLKVKLPGKRQRSVTLNTSLKPREIKYSGYRIRLIDLKPYPENLYSTNIFSLKSYADLALSN